MSEMSAEKLVRRGKIQLVVRLESMHKLKQSEEGAKARHYIRSFI